MGMMMRGAVRGRSVIPSVVTVLTWGCVVCERCVHTVFVVECVVVVIVAGHQAGRVSTVVVLVITRQDGSVSLFFTYCGTHGCGGW